MRATVDRIDEGIAVLVTYEESPARIQLPASLLPEGTREGDIVILTIGRDPESSAQERRRVAGLINRLSEK